jgi:hypothetical protein
MSRAVGQLFARDNEKSELAGNICVVYCSTQGDSDVTGEEGNPVCSNNEHSELGMCQTNTNEDGKEGRPIHAKEGGQALVSIIYRTYVVGSDGESEGGNDFFSEKDLLSGRDDKSEASYERTHDSDVGEEYSALSANAGGQSKGAGTKVRLPSLCSRKKQLRCMDIRQLPRCGFACVVIISRAAKSAVARCPVCQCAYMRNPLTSGSIPVVIHLCDNSCFLDCMACYHKKTVAVPKREQHEALACRGKTSTCGGVLYLKDFPYKRTVLMACACAEKKDDTGRHYASRATPDIG